MNYAEKYLNTGKKYAVLFTFAVALFFTACSSGPEPINYGHDGCAYCKMTISDERFGAEIITQKGKIYKFDATECMIAFVDKDYIRKDDVAQYLVVDAMNPKTLIEADNASFLISEKLPSPMGGNISAFTAEEHRQQALAEFGGDTHDWPSVFKLMSR